MMTTVIMADIKDLPDVAYEVPFAQALQCTAILTALVSECSRLLV